MVQKASPGLGRPRSFDEAGAAHAIRDAFWERGYEGTALSDLERTTGLNRSSLYNAFGDKREMVRLAVQGYLDDVVMPRLAGLLGEQVAPDALVDYFSAMRIGLGQVDHAWGCLLLNAAGSPIGADTDMPEILRAYHRTLRRAMIRGCEALGVHAEQVESHAVLFTGLLVAALLLHRADQAAAIGYLDEALRLATSR